MTSHSSESHNKEDDVTSRREETPLKSVIVELDGLVVGPDAKKWGTRCGALIRSIIPICYKDWRLVDDRHINDFWKAMNKEFKINLKPGCSRAVLDLTLPQYFRTEKYNLRLRYIKPAANKQAALAARPDDIDKVVWEKFVDNEWDEKKKEQCVKNANNRGKNPINHTLGRKPYGRVYLDLENEKPGVAHRRSEAWKVAHTKKNGEVLESAKEKWEELEAVEARRKEIEDGKEENVDDFENDELSEVFGPDKKSRCRAMTSCASLKRVKYSQAAKEIAKQKCKVIQEDFQARMEATVRTTVESCVKGYMKEIVSLIGLQQQRSDLASYIGADKDTPTEGASNSVHKNITGKNLTPTFDKVSNPSAPGEKAPGEKQYVILLSRDKEEVAKGYLATHNICHGRKVGHDERIVWVTEVLDPEARIYEAPQGGNHRLCEIADGGFLIWLEGRLRYI